MRVALVPVGGDCLQPLLDFERVPARREARAIGDTEKVGQALRALPVTDPSIGAGHWIGQEFFGINQELSFPFGVGLVTNGQLQPITRVEAATGK